MVCQILSGTAEINVVELFNVGNDFVGHSVQPSGTSGVTAQFALPLRNTLRAQDLCSETPAVSGRKRNGKLLREDIQEHRGCFMLVSQTQGIIVIRHTNGAGHSADMALC